MTTTTASTVSGEEVSLKIGESLFRSTGSCETVLNAEYCEYIRIDRLGRYSFRVRCAGRADHTGWEETVGTLKKAMKLANATDDSYEVLDAADGSKYYSSI